MLNYTFLYVFVTNVMGIILFDKFDYLNHGDNWDMNPYCFKEGFATY